MNAIQCPECRRPIEIEAGGWPFVFSQIIVHLDRCSNRPSDDVRPLAEMAAQRYFKLPEALPAVMTLCASRR